MKFATSVTLMTLLVSTFVYADSAPSGVTDEGSSEAWAFKLTPSYYATTHQHDATDINLRANYGPHAVWLGDYRRDGGYRQTRTGYEYTAQVPFGQIVPSLQLATHGFAGGSVNAQMGDQVYALLGFGRTNTRDYYNLNFDPNDSILFGAGTHLITLFSRTDLSLFTVKDNRLHTGQVVTHLVCRVVVDDRQRWTFDLSSKHGRPNADSDSVSGNALSVTYDYHNSFIRVAQDRRVNFSAEDQTRLSLGLRF